MKTLAKYHVSNHCVIGEKTFKNVLIGPDKLPGLLGNGHLAPKLHTHFQTWGPFLESPGNLPGPVSVW